MAFRNETHGLKHAQLREPVDALASHAKHDGDFASRK